MTGSLEVVTAAREFYHMLDLRESQNWHNDQEAERDFRVNLFVMALEKGRMIERAMDVKRRAKKERRANGIRR
jgi:hypothetical protein